MSFFAIGLGLAVAGFCIGLGIESGLKYIAKAIRETFMLKGNRDER